MSIKWMRRHGIPRLVRQLKQKFTSVAGEDALDKLNIHAFASLPAQLDGGQRVHLTPSGI